MLPSMVAPNVLVSPTLKPTIPPDFIALASARGNPKLRPSDSKSGLL